ncbi:MAG: hydrogenase iron-sulfur subunit [Candidatus Nezhaarchaeota archaeon]|nr:hydrogenase iron-sulfur subunit [Candidatus Nezhaarchaeota archaeon]MCX8141260.1 hydrogenase iron-sulfur subunit [Candidatus Nezhaarchaeota archaeon]MDW8049526.1 hydrogenase iron-sulfur subunit [Nitrososphaerota archaeon]
MSSELSEAFEPLIVAFCCEHCAYAAADLAGTSRMQYPPNVRIVKVPCTGRVDMLYILKAFQLGADGVFVAGCLKGGCHFIDGNLKAEARVQFLKRILDSLGFGGDRLDMFFMSSSMANEFVKVAREFTEKIRKLGPNPCFKRQGGWR